jgi:hypothetical protein
LTVEAKNEARALREEMKDLRPMFDEQKENMEAHREDLQAQVAQLTASVNRSASQSANPDQGASSSEITETVLEPGVDTSKETDVVEEVAILFIEVSYAGVRTTMPFWKKISFTSLAFLSIFGILAMILRLGPIFRYHA